MVLHISAHIGSNSLFEVHFHGTWSTVPVSDAAIAALLAGQGNIRKFTVQGCDEVTDLLFHVLACHCPLLEELAIHCCDNVAMESAAVAQLCQACPSLRTVRFVGQVPRNPRTTSPAVIGHFCRNLLVLDFGGRWNEVNDASIEPIVVGCPLLHTLKLEGTVVTKAGFAQIARHCAHVAHLALNMTDEDTQIAEGFRLLSHKLRGLDCWCCSQLCQFDSLEDFGWR